MTTLLAMLCVVNLFSQPQGGGDTEIEKMLDEVVSQQDLDANFEELYEGLLLRLSSPLNLNKASEDELRSLFILNDNQVQDLIKHRDQNGELLSLHELQSIPSFSIDVIRRLRPMVSVEGPRQPVSLARRITSEDNAYFITRYERLLESKAGFSNTNDSLQRFKGSADKWYARCRVNHPGDFSMGFTIEKDPGERSFVDYFSFHMQVMKQRRLTNLIVGDFQAQFGQGLVAGGGFGMGKGGETITSVRRNSLGFIPYSSVRETGFFRGVATSVSLSRRIFVHTFGSRMKQDAVPKVSADGMYVTSIQQTGFHRNQRELDGRRQLTESAYGAIAEYRRRAFQTGATMLFTQWDIPIIPEPNVYNQFDYRGKQLSNTSVFFNYNISNFTFFGEGAHTIGHGNAIVVGMLGSITRYFDVSIVGRSYDRDFVSPYANALAESSSPQNESGIYWGWKYQLSRAFMLGGYVDLFSFPWMRYRVYSTATNGHEFLTRIVWKPARSATVTIQMREEQKARNEPAIATVYKTTMATRRNYSVSADLVHGPVGFKTKLQFSSQDVEVRTRGFALAQDVKFDQPRWSVSLRYAVFDTDDFDNRQYMYEPDMWLAYSFPAYNGTGHRAMAMVRVRLSRHADVWVRWSQSVLSGAEATGSGLDLVTGPARNDLKLQLRIRP